MNEELDKIIEEIAKLRTIVSEMYRLAKISAPTKDAFNACFDNVQNNTDILIERNN